VIAVQVLVVSLLLLVIARHFLGPAYRLRTFAAAMLLTGIATSGGWFASQVMPDIFTAVLILASLILSLVPLPRLWRWALYITVLGCILMHNSNLLIALLTGITIFIYSWRKRRELLRRTALALLAASAIGWVTLSSMNAIAERGFRPSAASHVFLMSRMVESGMMDEFLDDYCPTDSASYKLCAYRGKLPKRQWEFMWDERGPLYTTGGWQANEEEYGRIIRKTLTTPKYVALHVLKATHATLRQLPLIYVGDGILMYDYASSPHKEISAHLKGEIKEFHSSAQQGDVLHLLWWNALIIVFALLSCITALLLRRQPGNAQMRTDMRDAVKLVLLFLLINAAVTATLATVVGRYEARVFWILPFLSILYILRSFYHPDEAAA
jgi:4-amino-4-deoxy-L-arabinose transferase-like glycosyltransferase